MPGARPPVRDGGGCMPPGPSSGETPLAAPREARGAAGASGACGPAPNRLPNRRPGCDGEGSLLPDRLPGSPPARLGAFQPSRSPHLPAGPSALHPDPPVPVARRT